MEDAEGFIDGSETTNDEVHQIVDADEAPAVLHAGKWQRDPATNPLHQLSEVRARSGAIYQRRPYHDHLQSRRSADGLELAFRLELGMTVRVHRARR